MNCEANTQYCNLSLLCDNCVKCGNSASRDYSDCNYENLFCLKNNQSFGYFKEYKSTYSYSFRAQTDNRYYNFCGDYLVSLYTDTDSFIIFSNEKNKITNSEKVYIHCDYTINNIHYFENKDDSANINFSINKNKININKKSNFNIFALPDNDLSLLRIIKYTDIITESIDINLNKINRLEILIDYGKIDNNEDINLIISINTKNSNKKNKLSLKTRNLIIIFCTVIPVIIALIALWVYCKRKKEINLQNERIAQIENENNSKKIEAENNYNFLLEQILIPKSFDIKHILNNCTNCAICLETFIEGEKNICITPCHHTFHYNCIKKWAEKNKMNLNCPNCKQNLIQKQLTRPLVINIENRSSERVLRTDIISNANLRTDRVREVVIVQQVNDDNMDNNTDRDGDRS